MQRKYGRAGHDTKGTVARRPTKGPHLSADEAEADSFRYAWETFFCSRASRSSTMGFLARHICSRRREKFWATDSWMRQPHRPAEPERSAGLFEGRHHHPIRASLCATRRRNSNRCVGTSTTRTPMATHVSVRWSNDLFHADRSLGPNGPSPALWCVGHIRSTSLWWPMARHISFLIHHDDRAQTSIVSAIVLQNKFHFGRRNSDDEPPRKQEKGGPCGVPEGYVRSARQSKRGATWPAPPPGRVRDRSAVGLISIAHLGQ